jgi:hypothetical protein
MSYQNTTQYKEDRKFGDRSEKKTKPLLEKFFKTVFKRTDRYNTFDFINKDNTIFIELKTRRCCKTSYPDSMMPYNKIRKALKMIAEDGEKKVYLVFKFIDELCYFELNAESFNKEWVRDGGRRDRKVAEINKYAFIPTELLLNI